MLNGIVKNGRRHFRTSHSPQQGKEQLTGRSAVVSTAKASSLGLASRPPQTTGPLDLFAHLFCPAAASTEGISIPSLGPDVWNKTYYPKGQDTLNRKKQWYIIDAEGQTLGRLATLAATHIRGKTSPTFSPSMDMGKLPIPQPQILTI